MDFDIEDIMQQAVNEAVSTSEKELEDELRSDVKRIGWPHIIRIENMFDMDSFISSLRRSFDVFAKTAGIAYSSDIYDDYQLIDGGFFLFNKKSVEDKIIVRTEMYMGFEMLRPMTSTLINMCYLIDHLSQMFSCKISVDNYEYGFKNYNGVISKLLNIDEKDAINILLTHKKEEFRKSGYGFDIVKTMYSMQSNGNFIRLTTSSYLEGFKLNKIADDFYYLAIYFEKLRRFLRNCETDSLVDYINNITNAPYRINELDEQYINQADVFIEGSRITVFIELEPMFKKYDYDLLYKWIYFTANNVYELKEKIACLIGDSYVECCRYLIEDVRQFIDLNSKNNKIYGV